MSGATNLTSLPSRLNMYVQALPRSNRMKLKIRKLFSRCVPRRNRTVLAEELDIALLTPITQLLPNARPSPGLLSDIEAELDGSSSSSRVVKEGGRAKRASAGVFIAMAFAVAMITGVATAILQPTQEITIRQGQGGAWVSLGKVALKGSTLRDFVHQKCRGQTHLEIILRPYEIEKNLDTEESGANIYSTPLMGPGEKILMGCIF